MKKLLWEILEVLCMPFMLVGILAWWVIVLVYPFGIPFMMRNYGKRLPFWVYGSWDLTYRDWRSLERKD